MKTGRVHISTGPDGSWVGACVMVDDRAIDCTRVVIEIEADRPTVATLYGVPVSVDVHPEVLLVEAHPDDIEVVS